MINSAKLVPAVTRTADVLAVFLAGFVLVVRPMFSGPASALHRNILMHLVIFMAALLATLVLALRKRLDLRAAGFTLAMLAFLVTTVLAGVFAGNRFAAAVRGLDLAAWGLLAIVLVQVVSTPFRARVVLAALLATLAALVADAFYQCFVALPSLRADFDAHVRQMVASGALAPSMVDALRKRVATGDVFGYFVTANGFAGYLILLVPAAAAAAWVRFRSDVAHPPNVAHPPSGVAFSSLSPQAGAPVLHQPQAGAPVLHKRQLHLGAVLMGLVSLGGLVTLALTRSKGGILALAVALGGWGAFEILCRLRRETPRGTSGQAAAAAAILVAAAALMGLSAIASAKAEQSAPQPDNAPAVPISSGSVLGDSAEVRVEYWKAGWQILKRHPFLGVGPGNFADCYGEFRTPEGSETRHAHNDYLEVAVEQGFIGLAAFLAVWVAWWLALRRAQPAVAEVMAGEPAVAEEDADSRRAFAIVVGVVGVAAVVFAMSRYVQTTETRLMLFAGIAIWLLVYVVQARALLRTPDEQAAKHARWLRAAVAAGVAALLLHLAIDFDFSEPGVTATLAGMLAVGLGLRNCRTGIPACPNERGAKREVRQECLTYRTGFGARGQAVLVAAVAAPLVLTLVFFLYPLIDMSVAIEQADRARDRGVAATDARTRDALRAEYVGLVEEALAAYPLNAEAWMQLARMEAAALRAEPLADAGRIEECVDRAKSASPRDPAPWALMAEVLRDRMSAAKTSGNAPLAAMLATQALAQIDGAVERYPTQPRLRRMRALILEELGRRADAAKEYRLALDYAKRTSQKELKFSPEELREILLAVRRLESPSPGR